MPQSPYININIGGEEVEVTKVSDIPLSITYKLEDSNDFQKKTSNQSFSVTIPATKQNEKIANGFQDPASEDTTTGQIHRNHKPAYISAAGSVLLDGKAFLIKGTHTDTPKSYEYSFYGGNGDWIVDLKEKTLFDFLQQLSFLFTDENIQASWLFNGFDENLPYVFAPVRYRGPMDVFTDSDSNIDPTYLRPSLSVYWLIYWGFKSLGYKIKSDFFDTSYFRRMVMPWTWGNFLDSDGTNLQIHKFLAKSATAVGTGVWIENFTGEPNLQVTNDTTEGAFDNNNEYSFVPNRMVWEYKTPDYGSLDATLSCQLEYNVTLVGSNAYCHYYLRWYHYNAIAGTTTLFQTDTILYESGRNLGREDFFDIQTFYATHNVQVGDKIICAPYIDIHEGKGAGSRANNITDVVAFQLEYFRIPIGGTIALENYPGLKKFKFLDFLGGVCDCFDIIPTTDEINKVVTMEPAHDYSLNNNLGTKSGGYFNGNIIDWSGKKDLSKDWDLTLFSDSEKELMFKFKDDGADGILKVLQDRNLNILAAGKFVFPDRFKSGSKNVENRFFAACTHYEVPQMATITGVTPQFICLIPENISNTSNSESANTFAPKIAFYKGDVSGVGGWRYNKTNRSTLPYLFAVNYKSGGENDPILSYSDERMNSGAIGKGLLKRFFWQRLAIMRNGQYYDPAIFKLNNNDVSNQAHREFKIIDGQKYELVEITGYKPVKDESTPCLLRKFSPIAEYEQSNTYPSTEALALPAQPIVGSDIKYAPLICLISDIPTTTTP